MKPALNFDKQNSTINSVNKLSNNQQHIVKPQAIPEGIFTNRQMCRQIDRQKDRQTNKQANIRKERHTDRQKGRQADRQLME